MRLGIPKRSKFHSTAWILTPGASRASSTSSWSCLVPSYGLIPVPPHLRHLTILSPFLRVPFPSQFLHFCFFCPMFFRTQSSKVDRRSSPTFFKRSLAILPSPNDPERDPLTFLQIGLLHVIVRRLAPASRPSSTRPPQPRRQRPRAARHRLRQYRTVFGQIPRLLAVRYAPIRQEIEQSEDTYAPGYTPPEACGALKCGRTGSLDSFDSRS
jgi:hypothetical protein